MKKNGPWTIKSSETKYKNKWIEVIEDQVIRPDGKDGAFTTVQMINGVSVLPLDKEGNVYLIEEFKYGLGRETVATVSGGFEAGEVPLDAAKRELKEELGIEAKTWTPLAAIDPFTSVIHSEAHMFLARDLSFTRADPEGTEVLRLRKVRFDEAVELVMKGEITHGASAVLILKTKLFLDSQGV